MELLKEVEKYWKDRSSKYSADKTSELNTFKREAWLELINEYAPTGKKLSILDIGTGPGFFAIIMAQNGHKVTAMDYTNDMLEKAKENAKHAGVQIDFHRMDAHNLEFADSTFDLIITRNLTWNLQDPSKAYKEWHRVMRPNGRMLNFDANWYLHLFDTEMRRKYEEDRQNTLRLGIIDDYAITDVEAMERIARELPLSKEYRPLWDVKELLHIGFKKVFIEMSISDKVWDEVQKVNFASTPMFMVCAEK